MKDFIVNFNLSEGKRYQVSKLSVNSSIRKLSEQKLKGLLEIKSGDWYNTDNIERSIKNINERTSELGYAFVEVIPRIRKVQTNKVDIIFDIEQGEKIYIDRINIKGKKSDV